MSVMVHTRHVISDASSTLRHIDDKDCNLAIWQRPGPFDAADLVHNEAAAARITVAPDSMAISLTEALLDGGFPKSTSLQHLVTDIEMLCRLFLPIAGTPKLEVRLEVVTTNACRKFHGDYVMSRLITTYHGSATQWLDQRDADRIKAGDEPHNIRQLSCGDVALFKGRLATEHPAIHRSPPIAGTGERRLVLAIDPCEGEAAQ